MDIKDLRAHFCEEHSFDDFGVTSVGIGNDAEGKPCLVVRVVAAKAKIDNSYNGVTVTVTVEGAPVPT